MPRRSRRAVLYGALAVVHSRGRCEIDDGMIVISANSAEDTRKHRLWAVSNRQYCSVKRASEHRYPTASTAHSEHSH